MIRIAATITALALTIPAGVAQADSNRDCLLEGTVQRAGEQNQEQVQVKFHSASKYEKGSNCRFRRNEKMEFKLPEDPRLKDAPRGSEVKYRYREDGQGGSRTELISIDGSVSA